MGKTAAAAAAVVLAGGGGLLLSGIRSVQSAPVQSGWQTYKDSHLGFAVQRPAGWSVRSDSHSIVVQNPSRSETVLMEAFTASPGESAEAHLDRLRGDREALFPEAQIGEVSAQPSKGDEVAATLSYGNGSGRGRALCSIIHGKGLVFVLAAPGGSFASDQPVLTHIVKSLRFMVPTSSAGTPKSSSRLAAAQAAAAVRGLHFVPWTDPREHGFTIDVPKGWKAEGGVFQSGPTDLRIAYDVTSPAKDMQVVIGDPRLPSTLITPNEMLGAREGINGCLHYMQAPEFNHTYLNTFVKPLMDNLTIGEDHPLPEVSQQQTMQAQQMFGNSAEVEVSVGITEFSGISKMTHKQISGVVIGRTQRMSSHGYGAGTTTWAPTTMVLTCNDNAEKARNQQIVMAVFARIQRSYRENPEWVSRLSQEGAATGQQFRQGLEQTTQNIDAAREASMGAYWGHVNAQNEQQRGFVNWMGDRTDVTNGAGETTNVQGGSSHYYQNGQTGTIVGTDSAYSPGVDFTPLTER